ncbi:hypothetical protein LEP1GSC186_0296 [Leptospira noguchii serovar Autumnalis str. ZUN142]|uniref:Uncharacterized protein n=1 Tax=Leptospira noguchii serovar Autumnalis str. ZUN142 TaxID=1085540 RepID=M6U1Z7_9LEPT|nr:hypothetical protein LEP1GSC186_0296 [Leptospira noguchii serovar Autumnalis str. ZUN142]
MKLFDKKFKSKLIKCEFPSSFFWNVRNCSQSGFSSDNF